ncbi:MULTISPECIES: M23 family metallopeptidase [Actinomycetes]|uniref:M23 family peptidase n=4 Tax=Actinomycetes TaxID=1760 RepID=A0A3Q9NSU9_BREAU|nr:MULTISPECIES: M23 family metallopeptidase [Actinomycetes]MDN5585162.1 M23 family metallopeptidase [Brevibacterium sp.]AHI20893.1 metalloendopeptidase-like membrane protein [Corynebacterium casei LMG S-19264]AZT94285.1 M23 family peptidase [Brevibacterium aurantiacum]KAB1946028.1 M23 family metallopeptidase [Brevibacterium linens ATCC 9172]SMX73413.1 Peptidase family M23 [Brevibacterium linens ATCC 9172]
MKKAVAALAVLVLLGPMFALVGVGLIMNPAASAQCVAPGENGDVGDVGDVPDELTAETANGETITLGKKQLEHAATIIQTGSKTEGVTRDGVQIALMAALTESVLKQLSNTSSYPESGDMPNDGNGSDNDSLGLFQMRPQSGWGSVEELMDPDYQAEAFYGGPDGPNGGSPRGLLDIDGWEEMSKGEAAQAVEVSAYPDRYANYEPVAEAILTKLSTSEDGSGDGEEDDQPAAETSRVVFPLPEDTWVATSPFGPRTHPITGEETLHTGSDFAAEDGTEILAAADGTVAEAQYTDSGGGIVVIDHQVDGQRLATAYIHMWEDGIHVQVGDEITAGQHIADVGSSGQSTGAHLHFEVREGGPDGDYTDPAAWLNDHDAADLPEAEGGNPEPGEDGCETDDGGGTGEDPSDFDGDDPSQMVDDPTSDGQITARMLHVHDEALKAYPDTSWACYSPRPGQKSEHPLGRACDVTFGNPIGQMPTPDQLEAGWDFTHWMQDHAEDLGVEYLIWQGKIWSVGSDKDGWRDYDGGGMHSPEDITGGHYDHVHITVKE